MKESGRSPDAAQREAVRCRAGAVTNTAPGTVPALRCTVGETLHRVRDTGMLAQSRCWPHHPDIKQASGGDVDMTALSRRNFLALSGSAAAATLSAGIAGAAMGPNDKFDLV